MKNLVFRQETKERLEAHLKLSYPHEGVGFLYGFDSNVLDIIDLLPVDNAGEGDQRRQFSVSPLDYLRAEEHAINSGLTLLGVYHSHPDHPAIPSEHDRRFAWEGFSYVITSVQRGEVDHTRSWQLNSEGRFTEEPIATEVIENTLV